MCEKNQAIILYRILIFTFLDNNEKQKIMDKRQQEFPKLYMLKYIYIYIFHAVLIC